MTRCASILFLTLLGSGAILARADPGDDAIVAMTKLTTAANYSWNATLSQNSHASEMHGKTVPEGFSLVTFVGYVGGSVTAANSGAGGKINTVFLGDSQYVVESNGSWLTPSPAAKTDEPAAGTKKTAGAGGQSSGARGGRSRGGVTGGAGGTGQRRTTTGSSNQDTPSSTNAGPRLPSGINMPHEQLSTVAANYSDLHADDGGVSGKLTQSGAELLLMPPGSTQTPPENSAGTFRLWIKDGAVTKYELKLTADSAPGGAKKGAFAETITIELTDVGLTMVDVPPAAKKKLGL